MPSSYQQATSYAALHGNSVNPNDFYFVFIGSNDLVYTVNGVPCSQSFIVVACCTA